MTTSCSFWSPDKDSNGGEARIDFIVSDVKFDSSSYIAVDESVKEFETQNINDVKDWNLTYINNYTFEACVKESGSNGTIKRKEFVVLSETGKELGAGLTQDSGCFKWQEPYVFNILAPAYNLQFKRKIKGIGLYKGTFEFTIIVNPWAERDNSLKQNEKKSIIPQFDNEKVSSERLLTDIIDVSQALVGKYKYDKNTDGILYMNSIKYKLSEMLSFLNKNSKLAKRLKLSKGQIYTKVKSLNGLSLIHI